MSKGNLCETQAREADIRRRMNGREVGGRKNREIAYLLDEIDVLRGALRSTRECLMSHLKAGCTLLEETPK